MSEFPTDDVTLSMLEAAIPLRAGGYSVPGVMLALVTEIRRLRGDSGPDITPPEGASNGSEPAVVVSHPTPPPIGGCTATALDSGPDITPPEGTDNGSYGDPA